MIQAAVPDLVEQLREIVGSEGVLSAHSDVMVYECDGFVIEKNCPDVVVFPETATQISAIVRICNAAEVPFLPRGAGTSLAGGCLPVGGGVEVDRRLECRHLLHRQHAVRVAVKVPEKLVDLLFARQV